MYTTLRDFRFSKDIDDIRGSAVYGPDREKLGKIDDVVFDGDSGRVQYLVIDTGGWLKSRRFLVPPDQVQPSRENDKDFQVDLTKAQIERFPALDETVLEDKNKFENYQTDYRKSWSGASSERQIPSQSPLSPRFLTFQDEITRNRSSIGRPAAGATEGDVRRKVS